MERYKDFSPESESFQGRRACQEDVKSCNVCGLQGLGRSLNHDGASKPQSEKGGIPWWSSEQVDTSYPPHWCPWSPRVSSSSHSHALQAILWGTLACLIPATLKVDLHEVPLNPFNSFGSSRFPARAARSAAWAEPGRFWLQLCHTESTRRHQACPANFPRLPEGVGRHTLSSIICTSAFPPIDFTRLWAFLPKSDATFRGHVEENLDNRRRGTNLTNQKNVQDPWPTEELVWLNRGIYSQGAVWGVDNWLEELSAGTSDEKSLSLSLQAGVPHWLRTILPQKNVIHIEDLKVDGGINWRWGCRRPNIFSKHLTFSNWEGRI